MAKKDPKDIPLTEPASHKEAVASLNEHAASLVAMGRTEDHGVYVARDGKGWSVFLHNRGPKN